MPFITFQKFHLILCHACIFQRSGYGKELYVPEGTITVRDSDVSNSALGLLYGHGILTIYENLLL